MFSVVRFGFHGDMVFSVVSSSNPLSCGRCKLDKRSRGKSLVTIATSAFLVQPSIKKRGCRCGPKSNSVQASKTNTTQMSKSV